MADSGAAWRVAAASDKAPEDRLSFHAEPEAALAKADFVRENTPEREEAKRALLARLDVALTSGVIIASSSSGLLMSRLQADCRHPGRCVIGHPFNPPHLVPLVEVVAGNDTAPATVERALTFYPNSGSWSRIA